MSKILKPYFVTIQVTTVVMAEDERDAQHVANANIRDICISDELHFSTGSEITSEDQLAPHGWDGMCLPYGGDGNTRLRDIIAALEALPERDTKTIDMFGG